MSITDAVIEDHEREALGAELHEKTEAALEPPDATEEQPEAQTAVGTGKKRGRPKGSKDAHPRTRTKPEATHTPSKAYTYENESPLLVHLEDAMADARQQELIKKQNLYQSWLPY